jgi:hypothetical protein
VDWMTENKGEETGIVGGWVTPEVVCSQEGAYEALEEQRRDGAARSGIECTFVPRAANGPRYIIPLRSPLE